MSEKLPSVEWEEWGPDKAREVLDQQERMGYKNPRGGGTRKTRVALYAREMGRGLWHRGSATLAFNGTRLLDGFTRLNSIVKSGTTQKILTVRGMSEDAVPSIDTGMIRKASDVLASRGVPSANRAAAAARICFQYELTGDVRSDPSSYPSHQDVLNYVASHPGLLASANWAGGVFVLGSPATLAAWHFMCGKAQPVERDVFFSELASGVGLKANSPVFVLREALLRNRAQRTRLHHVMSAYIIKAWNAELEGRAISLLRFSGDELFPVLRT